MGRYSSVQSYSDNNPNMRAVSHETATASVSNNQSLKTEKVHNPYGSTAGAGSGEFHIYRHARAREAERLKALDDEEKEQLEQDEYENKLDSWRKEEDDRMNKKRKKRMRNKAAKLRKKNMNLSGVIREEEGGNNDVDDEFEYTPMDKLKKKQQSDEEKKTENGISDGDKAEEENEKNSNETNDQTIHDKQAAKQTTEEAPAPETQPPMPFKNDGSFLEMMKKMQGDK